MRICKACGKNEIPDFPIGLMRCELCKIEGRKCKRPPETIRGWERAIMEDLANPFVEDDLQALCKKYGVTLDQFYAYKDTLPDFDGQIKEIADKHRNMHEIMFWKSLVKRVKEGDTRAISIYGEITKVYRPKSAGSPLDGLSEDDKRKRLAQLLKKITPQNGPIKAG